MMSFWMYLVWLSFAGVDPTVIHAPCYSCMHYRDTHRHNTRDVSRKHDCKYPCQCSSRPVHCPDGVHVTKDGCGCCMMCSRQSGEMCDKRWVCDETKQLRCKMSTQSAGVCHAKQPKPCVAEGVTYSDGKTFTLGCKRRCTCQNGNYGCVNLCPQESRPPSRDICSKPKLMHVNGSCCREWSCESHMLRSRIMRNLYKNSKSGNNETQSTVPMCEPQKGSWSPCSTTCGVGVSMRLTNDNFECIATVQRRLCYMRPCGVQINTEGRTKCTPTTKTRQPQFISFKDCTSIKAKRLKFCTTCKRNRCCYPQKSKTIVLKFRCAAGLKQHYSFQWIKKCQCKRSCHHIHYGHRT